MKYAKFYTVILLAVMLVNIGKYQLPYIEYSLFKDYIAANLCEKRSEADNSCQGSCHLRKQIEQIAEEDEASTNPTEQKLITPQIDDCVEHRRLLLVSEACAETILPTFDRNIPFKNLKLDIPTPPPKRFI